MQLLRPTIGAFVLALAAAGAGAQQAPTPAVFVQGGSGEGNTNALSVGVDWPSSWSTQAGGGLWTLQWEAFVSRWSAPQAAGGRTSFTQLGFVPMFRWRPDGGKSPVFFELGIGASVTDERFTSSTKTFGTRWNFSDNAAVGYAFGAKQQHEVSLRWQHTSNGGIKKPNPGLDLLLLRYALHY